MKTGKTSSYKRMGLIMLVSAAGGGVLGFLSIFLFDGNFDVIGKGMLKLLAGIQRFQLPILTGIFVLSAAFGEWNIRKLKNIGRQILSTEDEECDKWEYEEERVGAWGVIVNILSQILCILVLAVGYSIEYIKDNHAENMLASCIIFLICYAYDGFWQVRYVKLAQVSHPEKKGDPSSRKFQKQWIESCDEAEKEVIFRSSYKAYSQMNTWIPILLVIAMLGHLFFETGLLAIVMVAIIWLVLSLTYLQSCVRLKGSKLRE